DLGPDLLDLGLDDRVRRPGGTGATCLVEEMTQDLVAAWRVGHFGMELDAVETPLPILHGSYRGSRAGGDAHEPGRGLRDLVAVAHPHLLFSREVAHEDRLGGDLEGSLAVLRTASVLDLASGEVGEQLVAVADAEDRYPEIQDLRVETVGVLGVDGGGTTRQDQAHRASLPDLLGRDVATDDLGVDVGFPDPAGDQLGVLGPEVDDENGVGLGDRHPIPTRWLRCNALPSVCSEGAIITSAFWNSLMS